MSGEPQIIDVSNCDEFPNTPECLAIIEHNNRLREPMKASSWPTLVTMRFGSSNSQIFRDSLRRYRSS